MFITVKIIKKANNILLSCKNYGFFGTHKCQEANHNNLIRKMVNDCLEVNMYFRIK
jgi:hypothetical protein